MTDAAARLAAALADRYRIDDIEDWDDLFRVIRKQLGETDDDALAVPPRRMSGNGQSRISPELLKCVAALHLLHPAVMRELGRHDQLERAVVEAHGALARVRGDIIGIR